MPRRNKRHPQAPNYGLADRLTAEFEWRREQRDKHMEEATEKRTRRGTRGGARGGANRSEESA